MAFAFEHLEVGAYELLQRVAARIGDEGVVVATEEILVEERRAAERVAETWNPRCAPRGGVVKSDHFAFSSAT